MRFLVVERDDQNLHLRETTKKLILFQRGGNWTKSHTTKRLPSTHLIPLTFNLKKQRFIASKSRPVATTLNITATLLPTPRPWKQSRLTGTVSCQHLKPATAPTTYSTCIYAQHWQILNVLFPCPPHTAQHHWPLQIATPYPQRIYLCTNQKGLVRPQIIR